MSKDRPVEEDHIYPHQTMAEIISHLEQNGGTLWEYVHRVEGEGIMRNNFVQHTLYEVIRLEEVTYKTGEELPGKKKYDRKGNLLEG